MPTGKVKWFDAEKGFGFVTTQEGEQVFLHASALPAGTLLKPGTKIEFGVVDGRKGKQALSVRVLEEPASVAENTRKKPEQMVEIVEDLIKLLDDTSNTLRRGKHPEKKHAAQVAQVLRAVAADLDI